MWDGAAAIAPAADRGENGTTVAWVDDDEEIGPDPVQQPAGADPLGDLEADDGDPGARDQEASEPEEDSLRFDRWRRRSAAGAMMTGIAFGMQEALERKRKEVPIVQQADGDPAGPQGPIELQFDPDHPEKTVAVIRPWLMDGGGTAPAEDGDATPPPETTD
jgi:hypothetical protein